MNLNIETWKEFKLGDLFTEMYKAEAHIKAEYDFHDTPGDNTIKFISRTENNNGCDCYIVNDGLSGIEKGEAIVIGDTTATLSYQADPFVCGDHIVICRADWINLYSALFLISILKREKYKYSYGRAFKMQLISETHVKLPVAADGQPGWDFMEKYIKSLRCKPVTTSNKNCFSQRLDVDTWKEFAISDIFEMLNGKCITKEEIDENPGTFIAVQSGEENNGILGKIDKDYCREMNYTLTERPCLTVARTGSAGYVSYQQYGCVVGDSAKILLIKNNENPNSYVYLFLKTILISNKYKYTYGRKVTEDKYLKERIVLPAKIVDGEHEPDWEFMEQYIKSLPYGDRI